MKASPLKNAQKHNPGYAAVRGFRTLIVILLLHVSGYSNLWGQVIVVPNSLAESDGNTSATTPTSAPGELPGAHMMYIYDASQFEALAGPALLTRFAWRPDAVPGPSGPLTGTMRIFASTTQRSMREVTTRFSDNLGDDVTLVYDGPFNVSTANLPGPGNTRQFDIVYPFTTPFLYDPGKGSLVLEIQIPEGHGVALRYDQVSGSSVAKGLFARGPTARDGQFLAAYVMQLSFEPAPLATIRASQMEICWDSLTNATYRVETRSELPNSTWTPLVDCVRSSSARTCVQDPVAQGAPRKFYRVIRTGCTP